MIRLSIATIALLGLASVVTTAQEVELPAECEPTTLFEAFGIDPIEGCEADDQTDGTADGSEEDANSNPVSVAAKLPGSNREAALAHANEKSGGAVERAHSKHSESASESRENGGGNGNGNGKK